MIPSFCFSQGNKKRDSVKVDFPNYKVIYSEKLEQPIWLQYKIDCNSTIFSRKGIRFYTSDTIHTSNDLDYTNNEYDRGHIAPASSFSCNEKLLYFTFSYLNCVLQNQYLNRGVWKSLESLERDFAKSQSVLVTVEIIFSKKSKILPTGATVPDGFKKTIFLEKTKQRYTYYFPNIKPEKKNLQEYLINKGNK
jgi:DNA/RNA endonuclease G (NUC1)